MMTNKILPAAAPSLQKKNTKQTINTTMEEEDIRIGIPYHVGGGDEVVVWYGWELCVMTMIML